MMRRIWYSMLACVALVSPAQAQEAVWCDWPARADAIVEPWSQNTRTFANGDVRLALLDTIEPAAADKTALLSPGDRVQVRVDL